MKAKPVKPSEAKPRKTTPKKTTKKSLTPPKHKLYTLNQPPRQEQEKAVSIPIDSPPKDIPSASPGIPSVKVTPNLSLVPSIPAPPSEDDSSPDKTPSDPSLGSHALSELQVRVVKRATRLTHARLKRFLEQLCKSGNITEACAIAGVDRRTVYRHRHLDNVFHELWDEAITIAVDVAEREIRRRAIEGTLREKYDRSGVLMQRERVYSDKLAELYIRVKRPKEYGAAAAASINVNIGIAFGSNGVDRPAEGATDQQQGPVIDVKAEETGPIDTD